MPVPEPTDVRTLDRRRARGHRRAGAGPRLSPGAPRACAIVIGSRDAERAAKARCRHRGQSCPPATVEGAANSDASARADIVIVAVPWSAHEKTLRALVDELAGKIVVDCVNPLSFDERGPYRLDVADGSAAEQAAATSAALDGGRRVPSRQRVDADGSADQRPRHGRARAAATTALPPTRSATLAGLMPGRARCLRRARCAMRVRSRR